MTEAKDALEQAIMACVEDNTFSAKALDNISALRSQAADLANQLEAANNRIDRLEKTNSETDKLLGNAERRYEAAEAKLEEAEKAKRAAEDAMLKSATSDAVAAAYKDCLHTIFKPATVRRTVHGNVPVPVNVSDNGNTGYPINQPYDLTTEESDE